MAQRGVSRDASSDTIPAKATRTDKIYKLSEEKEGTQRRDIITQWTSVQVLALHFSRKKPFMPLSKRTE